MKCYFDESRDAQGQCQICGRFASRKFSRIQSGKFVCLECAYGGEDGVLKEVVNILEHNAASCGVCGTAIYQRFACYEQSDFKFLWNVLSSDRRESLRGEYINAGRSECSNHCFHCPDHLPKELGPESEYRYECSVCGEKWGEPIPRAYDPREDD